jgi:hypothetical protein
MHCAGWPTNCGRCTPNAFDYAQFDIDDAVAQMSNADAGDFDQLEKYVGAFQSASSRRSIPWCAYTPKPGNTPCFSAASCSGSSA